MTLTMTSSKFPADSYLNVGNAGSELFYGRAVMKATVAMQINL